FFYVHYHPQDLHSFPTRRSSDLLDATYEQISADEIEQLQQLPSMTQVQFVVITNQVELSEQSNARVYYLHSSPICRSHLYDAVRSEEHTSELQSRENLVCRLLLE